MADSQGLHSKQAKRPVRGGEDERCETQIKHHRGSCSASRKHFKIWPTRNGGCLLAHNKGQIPSKDLRDIMDVVTFNNKLICDEWRKRFQGDISFYE